MNLQTLNGYVNVTFAELVQPLTAVFDYGIAQRRLGKGITAKTLVDRLNEVTKTLRIKIAYQPDAEYEEDAYGYVCPTISGFCYDPPNEDTSAAIRLVVFTNKRNIILKTPAWEHFRFKFMTTLLHELVHRAQFACGREGECLTFKPHPDGVTDQHYLGEIDEIEAYARDIVEEWHYLNPGKPVSVRAIKTTYRKGHSNLPVVDYYRKTFNNDIEHPAVKRLFRKVTQWVKLVDPLTT